MAAHWGLLLTLAAFVLPLLLAWWLLGRALRRDARHPRAKIKD